MIDVSILGAGFMGRTHAAAWKSLAGRSRVRRVYSRSLQRAAEIAGAVGAEPVTDLATATRECDAVDICLPTDLHRAAAEAAFAAGKHVLLEKPIALTSYDADAILSAAERSGKLLMVGLVLRFWAEYVELGRRTAAGELGEPLCVATHRLSPPADWNDWLRDPARSGGVPVDLMVHDFDQMNRIFGRPHRVFARPAVQTAQHIVATVDYDGGAGIAEGSMIMPRAYPFSSAIRVVCERGAAEYSFRALPPAGGGNIGSVDPLSGRLLLYREGAEPEAVSLGGGDPWAAEISAFVACIEAGRPPEEGSGQQARAALLVALAANRSLESGRPEPVGA